MEKQECTYKCPNRRRCKILTELVCEYKKCTFFKPVKFSGDVSGDGVVSESVGGAVSGGSLDG